MPHSNRQYPPGTLTLVAIESPLSENFKRNADYARAALYHSLQCGEAPFASHLLYTQVLDDKIQGERDMGMFAGLSWVLQADLVAFYVDLGLSAGMKQMLNHLGSLKGDKPLIEIRELGRDWKDLTAEFSNDNPIFKSLNSR